MDRGERTDDEKGQVDLNGRESSTQGSDLEEAKLNGNNSINPQQSPRAPDYDGPRVAERHEHDDEEKKRDSEPITVVVDIDPVGSPATSAAILEEIEDEEMVPQELKGFQDARPYVEVSFESDNDADGNGNGMGDDGEDCEGSVVISEIGRAHV